MSRHRGKSSAVAALAIAGAFAASLLGAAPSAQADVVITTHPINQGTDNVIVNTCDSVINGPAALVQGCLNADHARNVDVSTTTGDLTSSGGQAVFDVPPSGPGAGTTDNFTIAFADGGAFTRLVFNINATSDSTATLTVDRVGEPDFVTIINLDGNGSNFYTVSLINGEAATSVTVTSATNNIAQIRDVRIGAGEVTVPEPASLVLLGSALLGFGALRRRKRA